MRKKALRVLYLHQYFVAPSGAGGTRSFEFARRLVARGHRVTIVTSTAYVRATDVNPQSWGIDDPDLLKVSLINVPYSNRMKYARRLRAFATFAALASLRASRLPADVVFATSTPLTIALPGVVAKRRLRAPMVFEVRDLWPEIPIAVGALRNPISIWLARRLERFAYRNADEIVALSPGMKEGVIRAGVAEERVTVIPNGCDLALFGNVPTDGSVRQRLPEWARSWPLVVYTGAFGKINGLGYMVDLAAAVQQMQRAVAFLLVGDGVERESLERRARLCGVLDRNLWIWPPIPKKDVPQLLAAADLCTSIVIPLRVLEDNSANKFFDALAAGKPVAINHGGWLADLLRSTGAGLVLPPDDIPTAARQVVDFVSDPAKLAAAGAAARRLAVERFDRERLTDELEGVLLRAALRRMG